MAIADLSDRSLGELTRLDGRRAGNAGDLDDDAATRAAAEISAAHGAECRGVALDVRVEAGFAALAAEVTQRFGGLDIWVNNAGIYPPRALTEMSVADWDLVNEVNLRGCFLGAREAARLMSPSAGDGGVILSVASVSGLRGRANLAHYTASTTTRQASAITPICTASGQSVCAILVWLPRRRDRQRR